MNPQQQQQALMAGMNAGGGPVGGAPMANNAADRRDTKKLLNTYIYDYFLKNGCFELARQLKDELPICITPPSKSSPGQRNVNGVDSIDADSKDDVHKRHPDLPTPDIPTTDGDSSFLWDWWGQFWDIFSACRNKGQKASPAFNYLAHTRDQTRIRQNNHQRMLQQMDPTMMGNQYRLNMMGQNGMGLPHELQKRALANSRNGGPGQLQQMKMLQQQQMQRDGSGMDMGGQRPQSPGSMDNAPSPKRQRTDGNGFNGQAMGPMGRGQGMPGQSGNAAGPGSQMIMQNGPMTPEQFQAYQNGSGMQKSIEGMNAGGVPQGSPMGQQGDGSIGEMFPAPRMNGGTGQGGNHALQDYQMQLMLLEQQNKRRLMMARQEQDNLAHGPAGPGQIGQPNQPGFPPAMSPSGSRPGPSPNPSEQMKRGTPKMGQQNLPGSPMPDGSMPQNRGSPSANFDPSQLPQGMPPQYYSQMNMSNGGRPPSSHPFNQQMPPQQMEAMRLAGRLPNGMWAGQGGPPQMMQQQAPQGQQPGGPMGTPQQRTNPMPPPPAPPTTGPEAGRGPQQTASPGQQTQAPPTPSQAPKAAPKGKKEANKETKKKPAKKGSAAATGATPVSEAEPPATPSTPITPRNPNSFSQNNGHGQPGNAQPGGPAPNAGANPPLAAGGAGGPNQMEPQQGPSTGFPGGMEGGEAGNMGGLEQNSISLDLNMGPTDDVLQDFDFESFLQPSDNDNDFHFDPSLNFGIDSVEAGGDAY